MRKSVVLFLLCFSMFVCLGQQRKAQWIVYAPSFSYSGSGYSAGGNGMTFDSDFVVLDEKQFVYAVPDGPLTFYDDGKTYPTNRTLFDPFPAKAAALVSGGMTQNVTALYRDGQGTLWFGSSKGLLTLPKEVYASLPKGLENLGGTKGTFFTDETPGMPFKAIHSVTGDAQGNVWVSGSTVKGMSRTPGGVSRYDGKEWTQYLPTQHADKPLDRLITDSKGILYGTAGNAVFSFNGTDWTFMDSPGGPIAIVRTDATGRLYCGTATGVYRREGSSWSRIGAETIKGPVVDLAMDASSLWVGTASAGVFQVLANQVVVPMDQSNSPLPSNSIRALRVDQHNRKWFYTAAGWAGYMAPDFSSDKVEVLNRYTTGYGFEFVEDALYDKGQWYLAMSDAGLVTFREREFKKLSTKSEASHTSLAADANGKVYMGTSRYLYVWDGAQLTHMELKEDGVTKQINDVLVDSENRLWLAHNKGVSVSSGSAWQHFDKKTGLTSNSAVSLFQDSKGAIWLATSDAVSRYDGSAWENFTKKTTGFAMSGMKGIAEHGGKIYFSNGWSLVAYDGSAMKEEPTFKRIDGGINHFTMDARGACWFATADKGVVKFSDGVFTYATVDDGLPSNTINRIFLRDGEVWASSGVRPVYVMPGPGPGTPGSTATPPTPSPKEQFETRLKDFEPKFALVRIK